MYKILGTDLKEYGPVSGDTIRQWITEGRANANTQAQAEGTSGWKPLSSFSEFALLFPAPSAIPDPISTTGWTDRVVTRDYQLEPGDCIGHGWNLVKNNFSVVGVAALIFVLIQLAFSALNAIPFIGPLFSLASFFVIAPLIAGIYLLFLKVSRGQPATVGETFAGFGPQYGQILLGQLVTSLLTGLTMIPGGILIVIAIFAGNLKHTPAGWALIAAGGFLAAIPAVYFGTSWCFTLLLIIDKKLDFSTAMQTSRKMTNKHFGSVLLLLFLTGLVAMSGGLACCIGVFFTVPVAFGTVVRAYQIIFDEPTQQSPASGPR